MKYIILLFACFTSMLFGAQADELFRWVDKDGKVHYGDVLPPDAADVERKKISGDQSQLSYETRHAQQNFPVTLYVGDGCGDTCDQGRSMLGKRGIPFSEKLLRTKQDVEEFKQLSGIEGVIPVLQVGKDFLTGFSELQWNRELDIAGYPKTASHSQNATPLAPAVLQPAFPVSTVPATSSDTGQITPDEPATQ